MEGVGVGRQRQKIRNQQMHHLGLPFLSQRALSIRAAPDQTKGEPGPRTQFMCADNYELIGRWGKRGHFRIPGWQWLGWTSGPALSSDHQHTGGWGQILTEAAGSSVPLSVAILSLPGGPCEFATLIKSECGSGAKDSWLSPATVKPTAEWVWLLKIASLCVQWKNNLSQNWNHIYLQRKTVPFFFLGRRGVETGRCWGLGSSSSWAKMTFLRGCFFRFKGQACTLSGI